MEPEFGQIDDQFALKRIADPYLGYFVILLGVTAFSAFGSIKTHEWGLLEATPVMWVLIAVLVFIGTRYRLSWQDGEIVQKASGGADVVIAATEIDRVSLETSDPKTALQMRRPFRRIAIYSAHKPGAGKFIDVSLKHFRAKDIKKLMQAIQRCRPDLTLPKHWT